MIEKFISKDGKYYNNKENVYSYNALSIIIEDTIGILDILSTNAGDSPLFYNNNACFRNNYNFYSAIITPENILFCSQKSAFSDSFVLLRKYRDDLFQYLYFSKIQKDSSHINDSDYDVPEDFVKNCKIAIVWHSNKLKDNNSKDYSEFISAGNYKKYLQSNEKIRLCCDLFFQKMWENINRISNDYVHSNNLQCLRDNYFDSGESVHKCLNILIENLQLVSIYFISLLLLLNSSLFRSSDFLDCIKEGITPQENSKYWIAPGCQAYLDKYLNFVSKDLKNYSIEKNNNKMKIE